MPMPTRPRLAGRHGQATLDPSRPLYVCRRISRGAAGALVPGQVFDASTVADLRLRNLYRAGHISHDPPAAVAIDHTVAAALARGTAQAANPSPVAEPPPAKPAPKPQGKRAGA